MKKMIIILSLMLATAACAKDAPVGLMPVEYFDFTEKEKKAYVSAVLDGEIFLLYGSDSPDYKTVNTCIKKEGIDKIVRTVDMVHGLGEHLDDPVPWAIAVALGTVCKEYK